MEKNVIFTAETLEELDNKIKKYAYDNGYKVTIKEQNNMKFMLVYDEEVTKFVLYVCRHYFVEAGHFFIVDLNAVKTYKTYNDCLANINGDIYFYVYGEKREDVAL